MGDGGFILWAPDPVKPTQWIFFLSLNENLAFPVRGENFDFTRPVWGFPCATFIYPAYISFFLYLKKAKQRPDRKAQPGGKFCRQEEGFF